MAPPGFKPRILRNEAFVSGSVTESQPIVVQAIGYRERDWAPYLLDPNKVIKPRLIGTIHSVDGRSVCEYEIDVRASARLFYLLVVGSIAFAITAAVSLFTYGFHIPGVTFFSLLCCLISFLFSKAIYDCVPPAIEDEIFLRQWIGSVLAEI